MPGGPAALFENGHCSNERSRSCSVGGSGPSKTKLSLGSHPKALPTRDPSESFGLDGPEPPTEHERDALIGAVAVREQRGGTAGTFDQARAAFEAAWRVYLPKRSEADFQAWRDQQAWTKEKYRRFDRGERMPPDWRPNGHV